MCMKNFYQWYLHMLIIGWVVIYQTAAHVLIDYKNNRQLFTWHFFLSSGNSCNQRCLVTFGLVHESINTKVARFLHWFFIVKRQTCRRQIVMLSRFITIWCTRSPSRSQPWCFTRSWTSNAKIIHKKATRPLIEMEYLLARWFRAMLF